MYIDIEPDVLLRGTFETNGCLVWQDHGRQVHCPDFGHGGFHDGGGHGSGIYLALS